MKISIKDLEKLRDLEWEDFQTRFQKPFLDGKLKEDLYAEILEVWTALTQGATCPEEYYKNMVEGTWIPTTEGVEKII